MTELPFFISLSYAEVDMLPYKMRCSTQGNSYAIQSHMLVFQLRHFRFISLDILQTRCIKHLTCHRLLDGAHSHGNPKQNNRNGEYLEIRLVSSDVAI